MTDMTGRGGSHTFPTFDAFIAAVDAELIQLCGLTHQCLADHPYYDAYESEEEPEEVARDVLSENDFPFDE